MYTSYFAKYTGNEGVSIALKTPSWFDGVSYPDLFPEQSFLSRYFHDKDEAAYTEAYHERILSRLNPNQVYKDLNDKVLLCYERSGVFCHRRIVADWIWLNLGIEVPEI